MPVEEAAGCLALIGRACLAVLRFFWDAGDVVFFQRSWELFRDTCQFVGRIVVLVLTLFQVWLKEEHDTLAGIIGFITLVALTAGLIRLATPPAQARGQRGQGNAITVP